MYRYLCYLFIVFSLCSCAKKTPGQIVEQIDHQVAQLVKKQRTAGVAFGIQIGDSISFANVFGYADLEEEIPLDQDHQFRIASITKPITATAVMQLVESGAITGQDKLNQFFPDFPNGEKITIYHLLSHTSGISNWWEGQMPEDTPSDFPMCEHPHQYLEKMKLFSLFEPGTYHAYSNSGYVLLGEIIEIASGYTYSEYINEFILKPAGMVHTEMEYVDSPDPDWPKGYAWNPEEAISFVEPEFYHMPFSAGGLRSTVSDLLLFLDALNAGKLIEIESVNSMMSYAKLNNGQPVYERLYSPSGEPPRFPKNIKNWGYGLGFQIMENFGTTVVSHGGDIAGYNSVLMYIPKSDTRLIILANTEDGILSGLKAIERLATGVE